jgi:hypothetical protein
LLCQTLAELRTRFSDLFLQIEFLFGSLYAKDAAFFQLALCKTLLNLVNHRPQETIGLDNFLPFGRSWCAELLLSAGIKELVNRTRFPVPKLLLHEKLAAQLIAKCSWEDQALIIDWKMVNLQQGIDLDMLFMHTSVKVKVVDEVDEKSCSSKIERLGTSIGGSVNFCLTQIKKGTVSIQVPDPKGAEVFYSLKLHYKGVEVISKESRCPG